MSDERVWVALVPARPADAWAAAEAREGGWLAAWRQRAKPVREALLAHPAAFDPAGAPAWVSLVLVPEDRDLITDDPAVQRARQLVLADPEPPAAVTMLPRGPSLLAGALTARRGADARARLADDPFARLVPARVLELGPGLIGAPAPPVGPVIERYGGVPWPGERFPEAG